MQHDPMRQVGPGERASAIIGEVPRERETPLPGLAVFDRIGQSRQPLLANLAADDGAAAVSRCAIRCGPVPGRNAETISCRSSPAAISPGNSSADRRQNLAMAVRNTAPVRGARRMVMSAAVSSALGSSLTSAASPTTHCPPERSAATLSEFLRRQLAKTPVRPHPQIGVPARSELRPEMRSDSVPTRPASER